MIKILCYPNGRILILKIADGSSNHLKKRRNRAECHPYNLYHLVWNTPFIEAGSVPQWIQRSRITRRNGMRPFRNVR